MGLVKNKVVQLHIVLLRTEPALVVVYPDDVEVLAGDSLLLTCIGYGIPLPSLSWLKNGQTITNSSKIFISDSIISRGSTSLVRSSLLLCNASIEDSGDYSCTASNYITDSKSENFSVSVQCTFTTLALLEYFP